MTLRDLLRFYLPLVATSQMMTLSTPVINLALGRASDPAHALAAYGVGFTLSVFLNSPALVAGQASVTLLRDGGASLKRLLVTFTCVGLGVTTLKAVLGLTAAGDFVFVSLMGIPPEIAESAQGVLLVMAPIPTILAVRGCFHGVAMTASRTGLITASTLTRLVLLTSVLFGLVLWVRGMPGEIAGSFALLAGIGMETTLIVVACLTRVPDHVRKLAPAGTMSGRAVLSFAWPIIVSGYVWTVQRPLINVILARTPDPKLALAAFGVIAPLVLLTTSPLWALQPTTIVLPNDRSDLRLVRRFAAAISAAFALVLLGTAVLAGRELLESLYDLRGELLAMVLPALFLLGLPPLLMARRAVAQGVLLRLKHTGVILRAALMKLAAVIALGLLAVEALGVRNGAVLGVLLLVAGEATEVLAMSRSAKRAVREGHPAFTPDGGQPPPSLPAGSASVGKSA